MDNELFLEANEFFSRSLPNGLTFDDVSLVTRYSEVLPGQVKLDTQLCDSIRLSLPMVSSDMDTVTESEMAIGMALNGGLGLIHYNMTQRQQVKEVARVKHHVHGLIQDPICFSADHFIGDVLKTIEEKTFSFAHSQLWTRTVNARSSSGQSSKKRYQDHKVTDGMLARDKVFTIRESEVGDDPSLLRINFLVITWVSTNS